MKKLLSIISNLETHYQFKLDFPKCGPTSILLSFVLVYKRVAVYVCSKDAT